MGSEDRYAYRQSKWEANVHYFPWTRHHFWWLLHNCLSHPFLGIVPCVSTIWFHDYTSQHLNVRSRIKKSPSPNINKNNYGIWLFHNVIGHLAIGLFPVKAIFDFHDQTAEAMGIENWL